MRSHVGRRIIPALIVCIAGLGVLPPTALGQQLDASRVRVTLASRWNKPSPDPTGLAYDRARHRLIVVDSEVEETRLWARANAWFVTRAGRVRRAWSVGRFSVEPTDVAFKDRRTLFISDDNQDRIFRVRRGADRRWGTRDDRVSSFPTRAFGSRDPEGLELAKGSLLITDGNNARVYRLTRGRDRRFNGVPPTGDDVVRSFDTLPLGIRDPEDIGYDWGTGFLYLISRIDDVMVRITFAGHLIDTIDLSSFGLVAPAGVAVAPGSRDRSVWNVYVSDRGMDNDPDKGGDPNENDGRILEFAVTG
jgi:hypothetical protein